MKKLIALIVTAVLFSAVLSGYVITSAAEKEQPSYAQTYYEKLEESKKQIEEITDFAPEIVIILGTGLADFADSLDIKETISYKDIGWPVPTAPKHDGNLIFAEYNGLKLAVMQGRPHYFEGYSMDEVVMPLRVLHMMGADTAILSNAVGSLNKDFKIGEFVCVNDQISSFIPSPLIGENIDELGDRYVVMEDVFDKEMQDAVLKTGKENDIPVHSGVFLQVTGPQFETPAEIKMYRSLGADTIAMSVADEVIAAAHMNMKICAINVISNMAAGMEEEGFDQDMIEESMENAADHFTTLIKGLLDSM